jgi:DNA-binding ferritin-like protein
MPKTRRQHSKNGTRKNRGNLQKFEQEVVVKFLEVLTAIKLYHWKTHSYATHKATDELNDKLHENVDSFVEVLLGKRGDRVNLTHKKSISLRDYKNPEDFKGELEKFKSYLVGLDNRSALKTMSNSDLYNIRDEMLANVNQFLYLLTFK